MMRCGSMIIIMDYWLEKMGRYSSLKGFSTKREKIWQLYHTHWDTSTVREWWWWQFSSLFTYKFSKSWSILVDDDDLRREIKMMDSCDVIWVEEMWLKISLFTVNWFHSSFSWKRRKEKLCLKRLEKAKEIEKTFFFFFLKERIHSKRALAFYTGACNFLEWANFSFETLLFARLASPFTHLCVNSSYIRIWRWASFMSLCVSAGKYWERKKKPSWSQSLSFEERLGEEGREREKTWCTIS